jgi:hypothetical protein
MRKVIIAGFQGYYDPDYEPGAVMREHDAREKVRKKEEEAIKNIPFLAKKLKGTLKITPPVRGSLNPTIKFVIGDCKISTKYKIKVSTTQQCQLIVNPTPSELKYEEIASIWKRVMGRDFSRIYFHTYKDNYFAIDVGYLLNFTDDEYKKRTKVILEIVKYLNTLR